MTYHEKEEKKEQWEIICSDPTLHNGRVEVEWKWQSSERIIEHSIGYLIGCKDEGICISRDSQPPHSDYNTYCIPYHYITRIRHLRVSEEYAPTNTTAE